jgi:hypothetical protein
LCSSFFTINAADKNGFLLFEVIETSNKTSLYLIYYSMNRLPMIVKTQENYKNNRRTPGPPILMTLSE